VPSRPFTASIAAGGTLTPLTDWQYERVPAAGQVTLNINAGAVGILASFSAGSDTLMERGPVSANGTTGELPTAFNTPTVTDLVSAGDKLKLEIDNPTGGAIVVNGFVDYTPIL
jgi:hypothetical protein